MCEHSNGLLGALKCGVFTIWVAVSFCFLVCTVKQLPEQVCRIMHSNTCVCYHSSGKLDLIYLVQVCYISISLTLTSFSLSIFMSGTFGTVWFVFTIAAHLCWGILWVRAGIIVFTSFMSWSFVMYLLAFTLLQIEDLHGVRSGDPGGQCSDIQNVSKQSCSVGESVLHLWRK